MSLAVFAVITVQALNGTGETAEELTEGATNAVGVILLILIVGLADRDGPVVRRAARSGSITSPGRSRPSRTSRTSPAFIAFIAFIPSCTVRAGTLPVSSTMSAGSIRPWREAARSASDRFASSIACGLI